MKDIGPAWERRASTPCLWSTKYKVYERDAPSSPCVSMQHCEHTAPKPVGHERFYLANPYQGIVCVIKLWKRHIPYPDDPE